MGEIKVNKQSHELTITFRWLQIMHFFLLFFFIAWDGFLVFWYSMALGGGMGEAGWIMSVFPIIHVAVGVGGTYYVLAGFLNTTTMSITKSTISIKHRPLPWLGGDIKLDATAINQIYVKEVITQGKNGTSKSYILRYLDNQENDKRILPKGITLKVEDVQRIERLIEDFLGIKDFAVHGEYGKKPLQKVTSQELYRAPQAQKPSEDPLRRSAYDLRIGSLVDFKHTSMEVRNHWQYDAASGESYHAVRMVGGTTEALIFFQDSDTPMLLEEKKIMPFTVQVEGKLADLPEQVSLNGAKFFRSNSIETTKFDKESNTPIFDGKLAFYSDEAHTKVLRVELRKDVVNATYLGELLDEGDFTEILS